MFTGTEFVLLLKTLNMWYTVSDKGPKDFKCSTDYEDRSSTPNILSPVYPLSHTLHTPKPSEPLQTD